jgi:hypothetical protein
MGHFRFMTAGESHGKGLLTIIEGTPAGLPMSEEYIAKHLRRRQMGYGRGKRQQIEHDTGSERPDNPLPHSITTTQQEHQHEYDVRGDPEQIRNREDRGLCGSHKFEEYGEPKACHGCGNALLESDAINDRGIVSQRPAYPLTPTPVRSSRPSGIDQGVCK